MKKYLFILVALLVSLSATALDITLSTSSNGGYDVDSEAPVYDVNARLTLGLGPLSVYGDIGYTDAEVVDYEVKASVSQPVGPVTLGGNVAYTGGDTVSYEVSASTGVIPHTTITASFNGSVAKVAVAASIKI